VCRLIISKYCNVVEKNQQQLNTTCGNHKSVVGGREEDGVRRTCLTNGCGSMRPYDTFGVYDRVARVVHRV